MEHKMDLNVNRFVLILALVVFLAFAGSVVSALDQSYTTSKDSSELSIATISVDIVKSGPSTSTASVTSTPATNHDVVKSSDAVKGRFSSVTRPYSTVSFNPVVTTKQDPIIGGWRQTGDYGYDDRYRFYADGTWEESYYFFQAPGLPYVSGVTGKTAKFTGTWTANGDNSYTVRVTATGTTWTMIYDPARNCIYDSRYPSLLKYPYSGSVAASTMSSSTSTTTPATTPSFTYKPKSYTYTPKIYTYTPAVTQDPIIGVWRYVGVYVKYDDRYHFYADGTYTNSFLSAQGTLLVTYGTWKNQGGNSYALTEPGDPHTLMYNPTQNTLYDTRYPTLYYTPYQGDVMKEAVKGGVKGVSNDDKAALRLASNNLLSAFV